jgi:hypothetical protein
MTTFPGPLEYLAAFAIVLAVGLLFGLLFGFGVGRQWRSRRRGC